MRAPAGVVTGVYVVLDTPLWSSRARQRQCRCFAAECSFRRHAVFDMPVLVVESVILGDIKPHQPESAVMVHTGEQVRNLRRLASYRTCGGLGQQDWFAGKG